MIQGAISLVLLLSVYVFAKGEGTIGKSVRGSLEALLTNNDYQPTLSKMVRMGLEAENVDWPILNELRGKEQINKSKQEKTKKAGSGAEDKNKEKKKPDNSVETESKSLKKEEEITKASGVTPQFAMPMSGKIIRAFGWIKDEELKLKKYHEGIDIEGKKGTKVKSIGKGEVITIGNHQELGNYILIEHEGGITALYAQLAKPTLKEGDKVIEGQVISSIGTSVEGKIAHLHLEISKNGDVMDPLEALGIKENKEP